LSGRTAVAAAGVAVQSVPADSASIVKTSSSIQVQGALAGSIRRTGEQSFSGMLSLRDAIQRGLEYNLSAVGLVNAIRQAEGQRAVARSALRPTITGEVRDAEQRVNLAALGVTFDVPVPGFSLPQAVGPFNVVDLRATVSQRIIDMTALHNYRATREAVRAAELAARDSRDTIVLAIGGAYLQAVAARARLESARAHIDTARSLHQRSVEQRSAGLATPVDVNRAQIQVLVEQQRLTSVQAGFAKQKINLARMIGIAPSDQYDLVDELTFSPAPVLSLEDALNQAAERRSDLKAAQAQVDAAERALAAAQAERLPSIWVAADYGTNRSNTTDFHETYSVVAALRVPVWDGGRVQGKVLEADAALRQRRAELEDLRDGIEGEVRQAFLDVGAAATQVDVAEATVRVSHENLALTRQRFEAGVSDNISIVQSQELVASAELDRINSLFAHALAKLDLARALGRAADDVAQFLNLR
jgi:outer membrane protein TolC